MNEPKTVFFIGKPGSGKGTQAKLLGDRTGWTVLGAGSEFRAIAEENTLVGRKIKREMGQGLLAPHWFAMYLYQKALFSVSEDTSVIFDGFSRKPEEAELIISSLTWIGRTFHVLNINVSDEEVTRRLVGRAQTSGRVDDGKFAVEERLQEYQEYTTKSLDIFRTMGVLIDINGEQTPDAIAVDVALALGL
ncbi:MAG: adk [Parcubacteria group bacterium]|nr:adk [Parcubacteria group bacterium]